MNATAPASAKRTCDNCSQPIEVPPWAKQKRFCSNDCRNEWHLQERKAALELLRKQREGENT